MKLKKVLGSFAWVILAAALILINAAAANAEEFSIQEQYAVKETVRQAKKDTFSEQEDMSRTRAESKGAGHIFMFSKTENQHWQSYDFHRNFCNRMNKNAYGLFQMDVVR